MKARCLLTLLISLLVIASIAQKKPDAVTPANIIITLENLLPVKDSSFRDAVAKWCVEQLKETDCKKIKAHLSADIFLGKVKDGCVFTDRTIKINHKKTSNTLIPIVSKLDYSDPLTRITFFN